MRNYAIAYAMTRRLSRRLPLSRSLLCHKLRDDTVSRIRCRIHRTADSRLRDRPKDDTLSRLRCRIHRTADSRLRDRPKDDMLSRLRDRRGETLAETLISLLIIVSGLTILAGGISTGARINRQADTEYAVVFPPPMSGEEAHFTKDEFNVSFRLSLRDEQLYEDLRERLELPLAEADEDVPLPPAEEDAVKTVEMKPLGVKVRKVLALDRNKSEVKWRILYVLEDVVNGADEKGADNETEPEENQIGE